MHYSAGIDVGGTSTKLALLGGDGRVLARVGIPARPGAGLHGLFGEVAAALRSMAAGSGLSFPPPGGVGIGVAGIVDANGHVAVTGALGLQGCDIRGEAERALGCAPTIDTDSNAGALADYYLGCARRAADIIYLSWGTGIGAGILVGGRLHRSREGAAGEIGHAPVNPVGGRRCYCGCRGCLEIEAGGRAIGERGSALLGRRVDALGVFHASATDDRCLDLLRGAARHVGRALASAIVLLNPQAVVLGGGVSQMLGAPAVRGALDEELERSLPVFARPLLGVPLSAFGPAAGAVGAALLPRHHMEAAGGPQVAERTTGMEDDRRHGKPRD